MVVDWLMSTPRAEARVRLRSRRPHSSSQVSGVSTGRRSGCWTWPFRVMAFAALQRLCWRWRPQAHVTVVMDEQGFFSAHGYGA